MTRTILITGASAGLGAEMARQFAALGYDLALCARRLDRLQELKDELLASHPDRRVEIRSLDVNDHDQVFEVFHAFHADLGHLDRIVVNAGLGKGAPIGTGKFYANKETAQTNFIGALAQTEAAVEIFREQNAGHLVMVSSVSALRGMPRNITAYAATKAGVANLAEGVRAELFGKPIKVTVLYPGYIESEMSVRSAKTPLMVGTEDGVRSMVRAIEKEKASARVPEWPWVPLGAALKALPLPIARRFM
jgi:short-subunit dehydrogenase